MDEYQRRIVVWAAPDESWNIGAYAFDLCLGGPYKDPEHGFDPARDVEYDDAAFRWSGDGFPDEATAHAGYRLHHPDPADCMSLGRLTADPLARLQTMVEACPRRFRHDPGQVGRLVALPTGSQCTTCATEGTPYEYSGRAYDGLTVYRGERLCPACRDARESVDGVNIRVRPDGPWREPFIYNTVADRDKASLWLPAEWRGADGRDLRRIRSGQRRRGVSGR